MDKQIRDIEVMLTLLELKLNSLPEEITTKFPLLQHISLNDITPIISITRTIVNESKQDAKQEPVNQTSNNQQYNNTLPVIEEVKEEEKVVEEVEVKELTPEQKLQEFVKMYEEEGILNYNKSLKMGLPLTLLYRRLHWLNII